MRRIEKREFVGKISHYYPKISVAEIKPLCCLGIGDMIRIVGGRSTDFTQEVQSMKIDRQDAKTAEAGERITIKVKKPAREGYKVYKL